MQKPFFTTRPGIVGNGSIGELIQFLEQLVFIIHPDLPVEYWNPAKSSSFFLVQPVPGCGRELDHVNHVVCYVRRGNESPIIELGLMLQNQTLFRLASIKLFALKEDCWKISNTITEALDSIIFDNKVPCLVDMFQQFPRPYSYSPRSNFPELVYIVTSSTSIKVATRSGRVFAEHDFGSMGTSAKFIIKGILTDWVTVLTHCGVKHSVCPAMPGDNSLQA